MLWNFIFKFDVAIWAVFESATVLASFFPKIGQIIFSTQPFGHTDPSFIFVGIVYEIE
jgi:hypothetical protein